MAILDYTIDELKAEVARREAATKHESARARGAAHAATVPPIGRWRVTTEGYCEGNTSDLGVHEGHVADIAIRLSGLANRGLTFIPEPTTTPPLPPPIDRVSVAVILPGDSSPLPDDGMTRPPRLEMPTALGAIVAALLSNKSGGPACLSTCCAQAATVDQARAARPLA